MKSIPLKIKLLNLAAEVRIIKAEEDRLERIIKNCPRDEQGLKWLSDHQYALWQIRNHRYTTVKTEARDTLLAYGFLRDRSYKRMEPSRKTNANWSNIERMILKYGRGQKQQDLKQKFEQWKQEAGEPVRKRV